MPARAFKPHTLCLQSVGVDTTRLTNGSWKGCDAFNFVKKNLNYWIAIKLTMADAANDRSGWLWSWVMTEPLMWIIDDTTGTNNLIVDAPSYCIKVWPLRSVIIGGREMAVMSLRDESVLSSSVITTVKGTFIQPFVSHRVRGRGYVLVPSGDKIKLVTHCIESAIISKLSAAALMLICKELGIPDPPGKSVCVPVFFKTPLVHFLNVLNEC